MLIRLPAARVLLRSHPAALFRKHPGLERPFALPLTFGRAAVDLNHLYYCEQVALMRADAAECDCRRSSHLRLALEYSDLIKRWKTEATRGAECD